MPPQRSGMLCVCTQAGRPACGSERCVTEPALGAVDSRWSRRSTARPPGRTTTASRGRSTTRGTRTRSASRRSGSSASSTAARRCSSRPGWARRPRSCSALLSPGSTVALAQDAYYGTGVLLGELERWGLRHVAVRPDRPAARRGRPRLDRGAVEPAADDARLRGRRRAPGARRLRRDRRDTAAPAPARARLRPRPPLARRSTSPGHHDVLLGAVVCREPAARRTAARAADAHRDRRRARRRLAAGARAEDARGPGRAPVRDGARRSPRASAGTPPSRSCATPASAACSPSTCADGAGGTARRDLDRADRERDEPRRRRLDARVTAPVGRRPRPGRACSGSPSASSRPTSSGATSQQALENA